MSIQLLVPLAGPDFDRADGSTKAEHLLNGVPLLRTAIESRSWMRRGDVSTEDIVFVFRDTAVSRRFSAEAISAWYPGAASVFLRSGANGAALSALAGISLLSRDRPLCVDLADIVYSDCLDAIAVFSQDDRLGGIALTFPSYEPNYSYLKLDQAGFVIEAAEKRVISGRASAGTYFFRNPSIYLRAVAHALGSADTQTHDGRFFVCPLFNGVIDAGLRVAEIPVRNVMDIKRV